MARKLIEANVKASPWHDGSKEPCPRTQRSEKEIVREEARGDKPYLRKSTDRKAQISPLNWTNAFLICALRSVDFLR